VMRDFPGTLDDYRSYIEQGYLAPLLDLSQTGSKDYSSSNDDGDRKERIRRKEERKRLERKVEKTERTVSELEEKISKTQATMDDPANATNSQLLQETYLLLSQLNDEHDTVIKNWEKAAAELEELNWKEKEEQQE
jgi:hypothetical protein